MHKLFIIGHSSTVFRNLHELKADESFVYDDKTYRVTSAITLEKSVINMADLLADTSEDTIIIMTCAGEPLPNQDATHRFIVTATRLE